MNLEQRTDAFILLGEFLRKFSKGDYSSKKSLQLNEIVENGHIYNPWFTENNIRKSIEAIGESLDSNKINSWIKKYPLLQNKMPGKRIGVVTAGNLPLVGFHDFITVLISGNTFIGKLSSKDNRLLKFISGFLINLNKSFANRIYFAEGKLENIDAVIATGSNNTSRYFKYYFGKYPHIIRKNRNSLAVLTGKETKTEMEMLGYDIFSYFGLGCRNVSKIFIPDNYSFNLIFENIQDYSYVYAHNKYANNYDYNKAIYLMNNVQHYDNGFLILKEDLRLSSPIGVVYFQYYNKLSDMYEYIDTYKNNIQCVVSQQGVIHNAIPFGKTQQPELWEYADNVDTMEFLTQISH